MTDKIPKENHEEYMDYTSKELHEWVNAGLVPTELLDCSKKAELVHFLMENKAILHKHYRRDIAEDRYTTTIPPQSEWHKAPDIIVRDKETGEIVSVLEMAAEFELCDGVRLQVKAKELPDWEKETAEVKKLDKEERETFKTALPRLVSGGTRLTRKDIVALIEEIRKSKRKPTKYRQSGHFVDEKLKYKTPASQMTIFEALNPEIKQKIEESKIEVKVEGIKLTPPQNKLVHALNFLLHEKSINNRNAKEQDFYEGNMPTELVPYGGADSKSKSAVLKFKPVELYKAYTGHDKYSGHDIQFINNELFQFEGQKMLIKYDRIKKIKGKAETLTDRIEDFQSLIKIISFLPDLTEDEKKLLDQGDHSVRDRKGEIVIALNPIFTDQIDTKFIEFPVDTNRRLVIAAGGHKKVTASMTTLMEWMLREISNKRYKPEINEDKLPYILSLEKYVKQGRKKILNERIDKDIDAIKNMGIILSAEKVPNATGGYKWVFTLNKDYN